MMSRRSVAGLMVGAVLLAAGSANAQFNILVIEQGGHPYGNQAIQDLQSLGYGVTVVQQPPQTFQGYDQVWDMRYNSPMTGGDEQKARDFMAQGGRMLVLGEHSGFEDTRNISLRQWISNVGAGQVGGFVEGCATERDPLSAFGQQFLNTPNNMPNGIFYNCATTYAQNNITQGHIVTDSGGAGGIIAWNFGDINGAPNSRLLAVWDIEVWQTNENGRAWTENMAVYLGRIPSPGAAALLGLGGLAAARRRRA